MIMFRKIVKLNTIRIVLVAIFIGAFIPFCLPATPALALTTEILKPTARTIAAGKTVTNPANAYDFPDTAGDSSTNASMRVGQNNASPTITYRTWETSSQNHSARRLYIRRSGAGNTNDYFRIQYTTTGGNPWTVIETNLINPAIGNTPVVNIPVGTNLANLRVRIDTIRVGGIWGDDGGYAYIYDIWLECDYTGVPYLSITTVNPSPMTPQQEWTTVSVGIYHAEYLSCIDSVEIKLFYDSAGNDPAESGFSPDARTCCVFTWTRDGSPEWDITSAGTTWAINEAGCSKPSDSSLQGNWVFSFKVGKVATYSSGASDWDIYIEVTDYNSAVDTDYRRDTEMNWYGEVSVSTVDVTWVDITPGSDFGDATKQTDISVAYIANGVYYQKAAVTTPWTSGMGNAALNTGGTPGNFEFSLKADETDNLTAAVLLNIYPTFVTIGSGTQTDESGDQISTNTLWLKLGAVIPNATFSGTLYYMISSTS